MFAVIRLRGTMGIDRKVKSTLEMMRLKHPNNCVLLPETPDVKGMLQKAKDYITWGEISQETLKRMLEKRLRAKGSNKKVDEKNLKEVCGFDSFESLAGSIIEGKTKLAKQEKLQPVIRLTPPSKGFRSINEHFPRGELGYRGKEIDEILGRMI